MTLVHVRISEFWAEHGRSPQYVCMGPEVFDRLNYEVSESYQRLSSTATIMGILGVQIMVIVDFGDEVICADGEAR